MIFHSLPLSSLVGEQEVKRFRMQYIRHREPHYSTQCSAAHNTLLFLERVALHQQLLSKLSLLNCPESKNRDINLKYL